MTGRLRWLGQTALASSGRNGRIAGRAARDGRRHGPQVNQQRHGAGQGQRNEMSEAGHGHGPARQPGRSTGDAHTEHNPEYKYRSQYQDNAEPFLTRVAVPDLRSEEHTSELQS